MPSFEKDYFIGGTQSNYTDYRKKKFEQLGDDLGKIMHTIYPLFPSKMRIRDFGCGTGALINQLKENGFEDIKGTDISQWAIEYGKKNYGLEKELEYYNRNLLAEKDIDFVLFLDVLEHMPAYEIEFLLDIMKKSRPRFLVVRVPISKTEGEDYVFDISKNDKTHIQIHDRRWWHELFDRYGFQWDRYINEKAIYDSKGVLAAVYRRVIP